MLFDRLPERILSFVLVLSFAAFNAAHARDGLDVPLVLAQSSGPACRALGVIAGLDPKGDGFLSVLAAPRPPYKEIDRVYNGQRVAICDDRGSWLGVIYGSKGADCAAPTSWAITQSYTGPCPHGWVSRAYVRSVPTPNASSPMPPTASSTEPGLDCTRAWSPIERLICSDPTLANLDTELNRQWINAKGATQPGNQDALLQSQRNWLKQRQTSCNVTGSTLPTDPTVTNCLRAATQARSTELAQYAARNGGTDLPQPTVQNAPVQLLSGPPGFGISEAEADQIARNVGVCVGYDPRNFQSGFLEIHFDVTTDGSGKIQNISLDPHSSASNPTDPAHAAVVSVLNSIRGGSCDHVELPAAARGKNQAFAMFLRFPASMAQVYSPPAPSPASASQPKPPTSHSLSTSTSTSAISGDSGSSATTARQTTSPLDLTCHPQTNIPSSWSSSRPEIQPALISIAKDQNDQFDDFFSTCAYYQNGIQVSDREYKMNVILERTYLVDTGNLSDAIDRIRQRVDKEKNDPVLLTREIRKLSILREKWMEIFLPAAAALAKRGSKISTSCVFDFTKTDRGWLNQDQPTCE